MNWWAAFFLVLPALYAALMLRLRRSWKQLPTVLTQETHPNQAEEGLGFSVLVAARNEGLTLPLLLDDLKKQTLPAARFEVIVVDDDSIDNTAAVVQTAAQRSSFVLHLLKLQDQPGAPTGKKAALQAALNVANAPWVICTDADCRVGPDWLASYAALIHADTTANFVSGPVLLTGGNSLLDNLMGLEFAGLIGVGAATIGQGRPTMCNGANLAYRREAFTAVQGFAGNEHVASGDDEFLLHKLHAAFPSSIRFLKNPRAIVRTAGPTTLHALLAQRVRWASKWRHYQQKAPQHLAMLVLGANVSLFVGVLLLFGYPQLWPWTLAAWGIKLGADAWFLTPILRFFGRQRWLCYIGLLQIAYAPYALLTGLLGLRGGYVWKGRKMK
ncbi:glycosyltransferase [Hymenobacter sp. BT188]|uniref:glycosyltransferase n=1 Tax=Hymenobacter sp. BT188 TaxID=2763504 RepID=UPI001650DFD6|nr:glycosyltransferase [Hymenobacter sp. BT188]MBC6607533.1 glycosyltransferase [Hymenobacter sp. BT188]